MQEIKSLSQFNKLKANSLLCVDFYATWCGPCKAISPVFERLAKQHEGSTSIIFAKCDVDKAKDVSQVCGITAMPTFQFFNHGKKVDEVKGADVQQLTTKIGFYTAAAMKEGVGKGTSTGESSKAGASKHAASGPSSLGPLVDVDSSRMLNTSLLSNIRNIVSPPPAGYALASKAGAQLLIYVPFTQVVTPSHLKITIGKDAASNAPSRIQVGTNVPVRVIKSPEGVETDDLTMDAIAKAENTQSFNIYSDEYVNGVAELKLKASKFTSIKGLTIRIDANMSGDDSTITKVGKFEIIGTKA